MVVLFQFSPNAYYRFLTMWTQIYHLKGKKTLRIQSRFNSSSAKEAERAERAD
jgi:hypothetical protein